MAISDKARALLSGKNLGMLGTVGSDGAAQVTPVWVSVEGDQPVFNTAEGRPKWKHMTRDPRVTLTLLDPENAYDYVELRGEVELENGPEATEMIHTLAKKYLDQDRYPWLKDGEVRVTCRMSVSKEMGMA